MARKRYRNKTDVLQIVYDEQGVKREVVPDGTIIMEDSWESGIIECLKKYLRYRRMLTKTFAGR